MQLFAILALLASRPAEGITLRQSNATQEMVAASKVNTTHHWIGATPTFQEYYPTHTGRGMWKWNVALDAYQRHFGGFLGVPSKMLEIGVQSGGSIVMYKNVLPQTYYYGMDINKNCQWFTDSQATIFIGDQADVPTWLHFFQWVTPQLDMCIDDGGHQAHQMLATIQQVLPHMNPGGFFLTEDIHGINGDYLHTFLIPAASTIAQLAGTTQTGAHVQSVHMYPFVLGVQLAPGGHPFQLPAFDVTFSDIPSLMNALPTNTGKVLRLFNPAWDGQMLTVAALSNFFSTFYDLYNGVVREEPNPCHHLQDTNQCTMIATNTHLQNLVKAVHITARDVLVETNQLPPTISAARMGDTWIPYNGP